MSDNFLRSSLWPDTYLAIVIRERYPAGDPSAHRARKAYEYWTTPGPRSERIGGDGSAHQQRALDQYDIDASKFDESYDPADDEQPLVSYKSYRAYSGPVAEAGSDYDSDTSSDDEDEEEGYGEDSSSCRARRLNSTSDPILGNLEQLSATARGETVDLGQHRRSAANTTAALQTDRKQHSVKQTASESLAASRLEDSNSEGTVHRSTIYSGDRTLSIQEPANNGNSKVLLQRQP